MLVLSVPQFFFATWVMVVSLQMHGYRSCIEKERIGLLALKAYINTTILPYDWSNDTNSNCCRWERVKCDLTSGRVTGLFLNHTYIDSSIQLNLSLFYPFEELQTLNLNNFLFGFTGLFDDIHGYESLGKLRKLEILDFGDNILKNSVLLFLNAASSLKTLILQGNSLEGTFPTNKLKDLKNLELLDLSRNMFIGPLPGLSYFHKLRALDLSNNEFSGSLENQGLCQLEDLQELDMSGNNLTGLFPDCFGNLTQLKVLDISSNEFNGTFPSITSSLNSLEYLSLLDNEFEGPFSFDLIANLSNLKVFKLSSRSSLLQIKTKISWQPKFQLNLIELQYCNLEMIPSFLQHQKDLRLINLSNNKLTGEFPSWLLEKNPKLEVLLLQNNSFTMLPFPRLLDHGLRVLDVSTNELGGELLNNIGKLLPNIRHLNLSYNGFQGNLPSSFGEMKKIFFLDLSHNNFSGTLPRNFLIGSSSLKILKLSYNRFSGQIFSKPTNLVSLFVLIADNNLFTEIADGLLHSKLLEVLDLSRNSLQGVIPSWLGGFDFFYLLISHNLLEGTLPSTLLNISSMNILDLSGNKFSGNLPPYFGGATLLFLNDNEFTGTIPSTLTSNLFVLDLRNNKLSGTIPSFVNNQFVLSLLLRGNRLTGHIPEDLCGLSSIKMLDLANNILNGSIPSCLSHASFGKNLNYEYDGDFSSYEPGNDEMLKTYSGSLTLPLEFSPDYSGHSKFIFEFASKSRYDSYSERSSNFMSGLDLSNNELSGEIPKELGDLQRMRALNLSHNSLSGLIPESFSNLTDIESIDLSFNVLHGAIPQDLFKLDYMVVFNVSYNNLSGSIPTQGKFSTLDETNFIGNPHLCGSAINKSCEDNNTTTVVRGSDSQSGDDETSIDMVTFHWSLAATYGVTWITFILFLCFDSPWRRAWFRLVDAFINFFKCV
ncbi:Receptor-like protein 9a [Cardamine amara subsp. amara]|uniref:Receptor-like protein 9a n=1 Tax=Cardamine amara subsp. amara TaxID=228776 RepID=A0ABD1ACI0_CARAN